MERIIQNGSHHQSGPFIIKTIGIVGIVSLEIPHSYQNSRQNWLLGVELTEMRGLVACFKTGVMWLVECQMKAVKKANGSNHETSPLDRNKMSQLFFVQALCVCPLLNDKIPINLAEVAIQWNPWLASKVGILGLMSPWQSSSCAAG